MYHIRVLHNYIYKLVAELNYQLPDAMYQIEDDAIITEDYSIVDVAESLFQFQPELLMVDYFVSNSDLGIDRKETPQVIEFELVKAAAGF